jgi:hypothetical protein
MTHMGTAHAIALGFLLGALAMLLLVVWATHD